MKEYFSSRSSNHSRNIMIFAPFPPPYGGMAIQALRLVNHLRADGVHVIAIKSNVDFPKSLNLIQRIPLIRTIFNTILFVRNLNKNYLKSS